MTRFTAKTTLPTTEDASALSKRLLAPMVHANKLLVANLEKLVGFQQGLFNDYTHLGLSRLAAAVEITDLESLKAYAESSVETYKALNAKLQTDTQALYALLAGFKEESEQLIGDAAVEAAPKEAKDDVRKAADATTKAADKSISPAA